MDWRFNSGTVANPSEIDRKKYQTIDQPQYGLDIRMRDSLINAINVNMTLSKYLQLINDSSTVIAANAYRIMEAENAQHGIKKFLEREKYIQPYLQILNAVKNPEYYLRHPSIGGRDYTE